MTDKEIYDSIVAEGLDPSGISADDLRGYILAVKNFEIEDMFFTFEEKSVMLEGLRQGLSSSDISRNLLGLG